MQLPDFVSEIIELGRHDQILLHRDHDSGGRDTEAVAEWEINRSTNIRRVVELTKEHGFIGKNKYGKEAYMCAWVLVQHGTEKDILLMEEYLELMKRNKDECSLSQIAYLTDKILIRKGEKQIYGSQFKTNPETGKNEVLPLQGPLHVDQLRAEMGMSSLAEYLAD